MADAGSRLSSGTLTLDGATLAMAVPGAAGTTTTVANAVVLGAGGGVIDIGGGGGANIAHFSGVISGGDLVKTGAAILQLSGNNTYTGATTVQAGTLSVAGDADLGAGAVNLAAGTTLVRVLETVAALRARVRLPLVLMTYYNPVLAFGLKSFARTAADDVMLARPDGDHQGTSSMYIDSISRAYFCATTLRLIFIVGVSSPESMPNPGRITNFLICSTRASDWLTSSILAST